MMLSCAFGRLTEADAAAEALPGAAAAAAEEVGAAAAAAVASAGMGRQMVVIFWISLSDTFSSRPR